MTTRLLSDPADAARVLRSGGLCAFPTETVYGLGADAQDASAVDRVFEAKGRPADNPLIVHLANVDQVSDVAVPTPLGRQLLRAFSPGPLTIVLPARSYVSRRVTAGLDTVAIRIPSNPLALALLAATGRPVVAPSANRSGRPSPTTWDAVRDDLDGRVDAILQGPATDLGIESTVVDASGETVRILRPGIVTLGDLQDVVGNLVTEALDDAGAARSPGLRHRHYAPEAAVRVLTASADARPAGDAAWIGLSEPPAGYAQVRVCQDIEAYAQVLYHALREFDARGVSRIDAEAVPAVGLGVALMDRLRRAAAG
ncbi:MAG: L-threonylcarbamoyladenylate synthase [Bacteroidota bacterium]